MANKPLDCVGITDIGKAISGKRPLKSMDIEFMRLMTETTGCKFVDVTPSNNKDTGNG